MEHRNDADARAQVLGVGCDGKRGFGRCLHEQIVDHPLVVMGDVADRGRQRVDDMEIADGEQLGFPFGEPLPRGRALTLGAMPIAAAGVGDDGVSARFVLATRNVPASWRSHASHGRATVRKRSIALITFSCSRLT